MDNTPAITATALNKCFGRFSAVKDLSLDIRKGEIYGFLGLNGAGKTTTIRMLLGMIRPSAGQVSIFENAVRPGQNVIWERVGYMVETPHAYPDLTVRENLEIVRRLRHLDSPGRVENVIEKLGLKPDAGRRARTLSLGNAQRLGLAKALIHDPDLLILDEPANGLDPAGIVEIRNLLRDLAVNKGVTIFMSSHILSEVNRLATRIGIVHKGRLIKEVDAGSLASDQESFLRVDTRDRPAALAVLSRSGLTARPEGPDSLIISDRPAVEHPDEIATLLVRAGSPPTKLIVEKRDLESYFLNLVNSKEENQNE